MLHDAIRNWDQGDVYAAWKRIGDFCDAGWVTEVLQSLGLNDSLPQPRSFSQTSSNESERAALLQKMVEEQAKTDFDPEIA